MKLTFIDSWSIVVMLVVACRLEAVLFINLIQKVTIEVR